MTQDEALKLALEALKIECRMYEATDPETGAPYNMIEAITAIKKALAQPEQEPVAWATRMGEYAHIHWGAKRPEYPMVYEAPLYTTPPQREPKPFFTEANGFPQEFVPKDRHKVEQEPVAWMHTKIEGVAVPHRPADLDKHPDRWEALYKAPPPCPTCEALARTVMMDQTGRDA